MLSQPTLFEGSRSSLDESIEATRDALLSYGQHYRHWAIAYSGGKDSSATLTITMHLIQTGRVPRPESITVLYADTRMELPPLQHAALATLDDVRRCGFDAQVVLPTLDDRFMVYMLGEVFRLHRIRSAGALPS